MAQLAPARRKLRQARPKIAGTNRRDESLYGEYCKIASKSAVANGDAFVGVQCYDTSGTPSPAQFSIVYGLDIAPIC